MFNSELGKFTGEPVKLRLNPSVPPIGFKARNIAFALRPKVEAEIDKLVRQGVLEPIENPSWSTSVVPVMKRDGSIRLCADYKCTINKALKDDTYPMPSNQDLRAALNGAKVFARLDMA